MTDDQIHKEVLKVMGWHVYDDNPNGSPKTGPCGTTPGSNHCLEDLQGLPPLTLDLMWQAEEMLLPQEIDEYSTALYIEVETFWTADRWVKFNRLSINFALAHASAIQRARAFLKVKSTSSP